MPFIIFMGVIIGVILFLLIIFLYFKNKLKKILNNLGFSNLSMLKDEIRKGKDEYIYEPKHVTGMTKLLIPKILKDFPNFSETELYNKVETSLLLIFNSLKNKKLSINDDLILVRDKLKEQIEDMQKAKIDVEYSDVKFHESAIKYYKNSDGVLNLSISTSLEYYYSKKIDGKIKEEYKSYKKQTLYTTEFIYVYNPDSIPKNQTLIGINCPNCGAPLKKLGIKKCSYCGSGLEDINLKSWHISMYKEEYR